ncbi:MAG: signal peptidase I [Pseudomonadota bacterium]
MAKTEKAENPITETIKTIFWALVIAGVFRTLFFQPFWIPSGSMKDTLLIGDFLFVNKMAYGYSYASCPAFRMIPAVGAKDVCFFLDGDNTRVMGSEPERGDVAVFVHPRTGEDFIKRVTGLPGDRMQMIGGVLHINGEAAPQTPAGVFEEIFEPQGALGRRPACKGGAIGLGAACEKDKFIETLPGGSTHAVLNIGNGPVDNTGIYAVPEGHYFMMGDNRDNSDDSRGGVGFVPYENIVGRADRIMFSAAGRSLFYFWTWRGDRFFKAIE